MPVKVRLGDSVPFPTKPGAYLRLALAESPEKPGAVIIMQGMVTLFHGEGVSLLETSRETTIAVIREGDEKSRQSGIVISYTPIDAIDIFKSKPKPPEIAVEGAQDIIY